MTRIFWETFLLISGSLFTFGAGQSNSKIIDVNLSVEAHSAPAPDTSTSRPAATGSANTTGTAGSFAAAADAFTSFTFEKEPSTSTDMNSTAAAANTSTSTSSSVAPDGRIATTAATTSYIPPVKKFVAAAVRSHFDDCPDSHRHFCFHGTCRFLILEETPACVCHQGFVGMRCEHADLLAVVATNHRKQTVATVLVLCVIGCVLIMLLCTLLNCWWRQECRRRRRAHQYIPEKSVNVLKHGASCCPSESVV